MIVEIWIFCCDILSLRYLQVWYAQTTDAFRILVLACYKSEAFEKENHCTSLLAPHFPASEEEENHELHFKKMLESRPEDALVKLFRLWRL